MPLSTESLSLEVEPLLLVPDLLDVRDMADLVAALNSMRLIPRCAVKAQRANAHLNMAAEVSMLSSIVRICVGGSVQRSFRSCSSENMHSLMLPCMKYRFRINIGRTQ